MMHIQYHVHLLFILSFHICIHYVIGIESNTQLLNSTQFAKQSGDRLTGKTLAETQLQEYLLNRYEIVSGIESSKAVLPLWETTPPG